MMRHLIQHVLTQTGKDSELDKFSVKSLASSFPAFHALNNAVWFGNQFWTKNVDTYHMTKTNVD